MSESILLIGTEPAFQDRLNPLLQDVGVDLYGADESQQALDILEHRGPSTAAVVLGPLLENPVRLAQRIHRIDREIPVLVLSHGDYFASLSRALQFTPFLGDQVSSYDTADIMGIAESLNSSVHQRGQRQQFRTTIAAMNQQLKTFSSRRISAVQYLDHVLDHAPVGIIVMDAYWQIISSNRQAGEILEQQERQFLGSSLINIFPEGERERLRGCLHRSGDNERRSQPEVFARLTSDGDTQYVGITPTALPVESAERVMLVILQDVTTQVVNQQERENALRLRDEFLSMAAHELKTPLTSTKGFVELLGRRLQQPDWNRMRIIRLQEQLRGQVERLERLVTDLLDASRIQQGRLDPNPEPLDLVELADQVLQRFGDQPAGKPPHLLVLDAPEPVTGIWDTSRLDQVITNLVSNAIKYSPDDGEVTVSVRTYEGQAELAVTDKGVGIHPDVRARLFQPFMRGDIGGEVPGTGLGLHITSQIVKQHGGTISVISEPGAGSTFTVSLPFDYLRSVQEEQTAVPEHARASVSPFQP